MELKYEHKKVEEGKYNTWKDNGYFNSGDTSKEPFCIVIPPPNVTGQLHMGHAYDGAIQDVIIRYKRMQGYDTLYLPGMDHAGIATQARVDAKLKSMGINPREMDREEWLKHAWEWKEEYATTIRKQWAKLGLSLDYSKERFTLDKGLNDAVNHVFITLYNKGLIYQGKRIINWDPEAMTALSNEEVIYKDVEGAFYHIKYYVDDDTYLTVATTRPETLFGDTAVAVNKDDERYKHLIGKTVILPIINKRIPIIADIHADMEKGTGVVKITPAHDPNDFEVGERHNLERIIVINKDGTMNENAGKYNGMDRFECRKELIKDLKEQDLLVKIETITHNVGHSERTDVMVEPYLSKQWFVKMDKLSHQVLENQKTNNKVKFIPPRFEKILNHWMEDCHDWCISRQLWWGHRIPAWYKDGEVKVQVESPGEGWMQDNDVLDTWFSSALWPFSILGFPNNTPDLERCFPTDVLVTGYDIIFFWVSRMIFTSLEFNNDIPFKECIIHGLVRAEDGRKMSKSLGNGIDPLEVIDKYGTDSLRWFLTTTSSLGLDFRYEEEKVASSWNFINKLWNISRYVLLKNEENNPSESLSNIDKWIITRLNKTIKEVTKHMDKYEFNLAGTSLYNFIYDDFSSWYVELSKNNKTKETTETLNYVLINILKLLHPFMPFVTEEIYSNFTKDSIMISNYPKYNKNEIYDETSTNNLIEVITNIRRIKQDKNIKDFYIETKSNIIKDNIETIKLLTKLKEKSTYNKEERQEFIVNNELFTIVYDNSLNYEEELIKTKQEIEKLKNQITRRETLLSNENYVNKAPKALVDKEKQTLQEEKQQLELLLKSIK